MSRRIEVKVKTMVREEFVREVEGKIEVGVRVAPIDGKANQRVVKLLSEYFGIPKSSIILKSGYKSKNKIFEIL